MRFTNHDDDAPQRVSTATLRRLVAQERADLVAFLRTMTDDDWATPSLCAGWQVRDVLADTLVHHQDIRRPLGRPRTIPQHRLIPVLNRPDPFAHPGNRTRGLRFVATDIGWARSHGPEVRGTGEALALAAAGRAIVLDELTGDGVPVLRTRISPCGFRASSG